MFMNLRFSGLVLSLSMLFSSSLAAEIENYFNSNRITFQQGDGFEVGDSRRNIWTLEHISGWNWGDLFFFYDRIDGLETDSLSYYTEFSPRFSLAPLGFEARPPMVRDILLASTLEKGSGGFKAYLAGPGVTWDLPKGMHLESNLYLRDNPDLSGATWQFTTAWSLPFSLWAVDFLFDGYADLRGSEGGNKGDLNFNPQLKVDLGKLVGYPQIIYAGVEYYHWNNKFGIEGVDERLLSPLLQAHYSY
ncbi:MAG: hypothetical protein JMN25_17970 [gamma proteobacterium endosymbiont of Lamellibrachia anaximandri]|nr:hypothetical protein [gamma proteobacterium endosymbiont of Lamellibrachia anaximandri]